MATLFRRIRQRLISNNRVSKYLIYAIGEIILVVIGILIALQINNLNENNKDIAQENVYLKNLKDDLNGIIEAYNEANKVEDVILKQTKDILKHYQINNGFYNMDTIFPKLNDLTVRWNVTPSATTLVELINSGQTKLIRNTNLRKNLVAFNEQLGLWTANTTNNNTNLVDKLIVPELFKYGAYSSVGYSDEMASIFKKYTYEDFITTSDTSLLTQSVKRLNHPDYKLNIVNLVNHRHALASLQKGVNNGIITKVEELLQSLEKEISND